MAHGERAELNGLCGREYWSRRCNGAPLWGWFGKWLTHRRERREAERLTREAHDEFDRILEETT